MAFKRNAVLYFLCFLVRVGGGVRRRGLGGRGYRGREGGRAVRRGGEGDRGEGKGEMEWGVGGGKVWRMGGWDG